MCVSSLIFIIRFIKAVLQGENEMRVVATQSEESVICSFPEGKEIEIFMISAEGESLHCEPDVESAQSILQELSRIAGPVLPNLLASPL